MKKLFVLLLLLGVASSAWASTDWMSNAASSDWFTAANWSNGVPTSTIIVNTRTYGGNGNPNFQPVISGAAASAHQLDIGGSSQAGTLQVPPIVGSVTLNSGASLTVTDYIRIGSSSSSNRWGFFYMNGGTLNANNYLSVGYGTGVLAVKGSMKMIGGTVNVVNAFTIGLSANTSGYMDMDGGTINAGDFAMKVTASTWTPIVSLDISGGKIVITGDKRIKVAGEKNDLYDWIDAGWIKTNGTAWEDYANVSYNAGTNKTTIIPEPATLCLLGLGALSLIRRKR